MCKKTLTAALVFCVLGLNLHAYNPPAGGELVFRLVNPDLLSGAGSAAGGALWSAVPGAPLVNPALTAGDQRVMLDLGYTALIAAGDPNPFGSAARIGALIPTRRGVFTLSINGIFSPMSALPLGNIILFNGSFSKDITDRLYVGAALNFGMSPGSIFDWALYADLGVWYNFGTVGFLRDFRLGGALSTLGKSIQGSSRGVISPLEEVGFFPGIATPRLGIAAHLFEAQDFRGGFSLDISAPFWQNFITDIGLQFDYAETVRLAVGWEINARELAASVYNLMPSISLSAKIRVDTQKNRFLADKGWQRNDLALSGAWQQLYGGVHAASIGAAAYLGMRDTEAPVIRIWEEE